MAEAARPEDRETLQALELRNALMQEDQRMHGRTLDNVYPKVDDLTGWMLFFVPQDASAEEYRRVLQLSTTHAAERIAALQRVRSRVLALELQAAAIPADRNKTYIYDENAGHWALGRYVAPRALFVPGGECYQLLVQAQLSAYRAMEPQLTEADRKALLMYWIPRMVGVSWVPNGMPKMYSGSHRVGTYITEFVRCRGLDDAGRERVRTIGRQWATDDDALMQDALKQMLRGKTMDVQDLNAQRAQRASKARTDLQVIPGLEWLKDKNATMPTDLGPVNEADAKEFGLSFASSSRPKEGDGEETATAPGLPVGYSRQVEEQLGDLLRLSGDQRLVFATVLADARERWRQTVQPLCVQARNRDDHSIMRDQPGDGEVARRTWIEARLEAWNQACAGDKSTFDALAAALGPEYDTGALLLLRASRNAYRSIENDWPKDPYDVMDVATCVLATPVSAAGRAAAIAAAAPLIEGWMMSVTALDEHVMNVMRRDRYDMSGETTHLRAECNQLGQRIAEAVLAAVDGADHVRYQNAFLAVARPDVLADPCYVWRALDRLLANSPAEQRAALQAAIAPALAEYDTRWRAIADVAVKTKPVLKNEHENNVYRDAQVALVRASHNLNYVIQLRLHAVLPAGTELPFGAATGPRKLKSLPQLLEQLAGAATSSAASQPAP